MTARPRDTRYQSAVGQFIDGRPLPPSNADLRDWGQARWFWESYLDEEGMRELDDRAAAPREPPDPRPPAPTRLRPS